MLKTFVIIPLPIQKKQIIFVITIINQQFPNDSVENNHIKIKCILFSSYLILHFFT